MSFATAPSFSVWLETERRHVRGATEALLHESALSFLATGDASQAADLAGQLVRMDPYDENAQALLVRCLAAAGEGIAAARQVAACRELFQRELGVAPGPALEAAAAASDDPRELAEIEKIRGSALSDVGRYDAALASLRNALELSTDDRLAGYVWSMIGRVHLLRGQWEAAADGLDQSLDVARRCGWTAFAPWPEALRAGVDLARGALGQATERLDHAFAMSC
jgi:tetratricopeptide (TPR) repeat protein